MKSIYVQKQNRAKTKGRRSHGGQSNYIRLSVNLCVSDGYRVGKRAIWRAISSNIKTSWSKSFKRDKNPEQSSSRTW